MPLTPRSLEPRHVNAWDAFVAAHPAGTFFHRAAWSDIIATSFGHISHYTFVERDGVIAGVLPLMHMKSLLFGNTLVSTPFCVYGGPLSFEPEAAEILAAHAESLRARLGATAVEFRHRDPVESTWLTRSDLYVTFRKTITGSDDANMKAIPRKQRAMVRKGIQNGLLSVADQDVDTLYHIYAESVRNLGTPVFPRRYFHKLIETFRDCADVVSVLDSGVPVAAVLNFYYRDEVLPYYGGGTHAARQVAGNDFMYWEVMRRAATRGCRLFDFGRSKIGTGAFSFKRNWGFEPTPLHYRYSLERGAHIPDHNPLNPKYQMFIAAWKRLPLPLANLLGPMVVRGLG
jgi:FemAB-related protein (PEP-CTERM system-associated)